MEIFENDIKVIAGDCIDKAFSRWKNNVCDENYKEIDAMKKDLKDIKNEQGSLRECVIAKFNKIYFLLFGALITLIINLIYAIVKK